MRLRSPLPGLVLCLAVVLMDGSGPVRAAADPQADGQAVFLPLQAHAAYIDEAPQPLIFAVAPDGLANNDADEAVAIQNVGRNPLWLAGWQMSDGEGTVTLPALIVAPGRMIWCTRQAAAFRLHWGFRPDCEYEADSDPDVPDGSGRAPNLSNAGDELQLLAPNGIASDGIPFGGSPASLSGWTGPAVPFYQANPRFGREGQVFYRLFDPATSLALPDTNAAADWAQGNLDPARGRRTAYPGWDLLIFTRPTAVQWSQGATAQLLIAPDNTFEAVADLLRSAHSSIHLQVYELRHPELARLLAERAAAGVEVSVLLEGGPTGGLEDAERWAGQQIVAAGGAVHFMVNDVADANDRYAYMHAKFAIIDGETVFVSTENFNPDSMPPDASDGETWGRRGYAVVLSNAALAAGAEAVFQADNDLAHLDIFPWQADHPDYGAPPAGYAPPEPGNQAGYAVRQASPITVTDVSKAMLFTSPEATLTPGPLLDLIGRAEAGDVIYSQQLYEHTYWGGANATPQSDVNVRLEALIAAARRGATVRLLLDGFFDSGSEARSNAKTVAYVNEIAQAEGLDLEAATGNPTGGGLHAKLHLLSLGLERWAVLGSANGGEVSNKLNREMMIALQSAQAHAALERIFVDDWLAVQSQLGNKKGIEP